MSPFEMNYLIDTAQTACPDCFSDNLIEDYSSADLICTQCGRVVCEKLPDRSAEWRSFTDDQHGVDQMAKARADTDYRMGLIELSTSIGAATSTQNLGSSRKKLSSSSSTAKGLSRLQAKIANPNLLKHKNANEILRVHAERMGLPRTHQQTALQVFFKAIETPIKGSTDALVAVALFVTCRQHKVARTFREMSQITSVPVKELGRVFRLLKPTLETLMSKPEEQVAEESQLIYRFCDDLGLRHLHDSITRVTELVLELGITGGGGRYLQYIGTDHSHVFQGLLRS